MVIEKSSGDIETPMSRCQNCHHHHGSDFTLRHIRSPSSTFLIVFVTTTSISISITFITITITTLSITITMHHKSLLTSLLPPFPLSPPLPSLLFRFFALTRFTFAFASSPAALPWQCFAWRASPSPSLSCSCSSSSPSSSSLPRDKSQHLRRRNYPSSQRNWSLHSFKMDEYGTCNHVKLFTSLQLRHKVKLNSNDHVCIMKMNDLAR